MNTTNGFDLTGKWAEATEAVIHLMIDGVDPRYLTLPKGYGSTLAVERYARAYVDVNPRVSFALIYGVASCGVCVAGQGGWMLPCPIKGGGQLEVPLIQHFIGVAPSGMRKSTALDAARRPVKRALIEGVKWRTEKLRDLRTRAENRARELLAERGDPRQTEVDRKQFISIFTSGICPATLLKDPTPESLRDFLVSQGGVAGVWSAEADVFRNIAAYSKDTGSLTFLLDLWQQEDISTARVTAGLIQMDEVALVMAVLLQNDVFAEVTGGSGQRGGTDNFIARGMFGRNWVVRAPDVGGYEALAAEYGDDEDVTLGLDADGMTDENGVITPLGDALLEYEANLQTLVEESNNYRMHKALRRAWEQVQREVGSDIQVDEPEDVPRHRIKLDAKARMMYRRVQRMQLAIEAALAAPDVEEDVRMVFNPLAARITQHVMREAFVMALGAGYRTVTADMIEDAATRIFPWRVANTADALLSRTDEIATQAVATMSVQNPTMDDRSVAAAVLRALGRLAAGATREQRDAGFTATDVTNKVRNAFSDKSQRRGVGGLVRQNLEALANQPGSPVTLSALDGGTARYILREQASTDYN